MTSCGDVRTWRRGSQPCNYSNFNCWSLGFVLTQLAFAFAAVYLWHSIPHKKIICTWVDNKTCLQLLQQYYGNKFSATNYISGQRESYELYIYIINPRVSLSNVRPERDKSLAALDCWTLLRPGVIGPVITQLNQLSNNHSRRRHRPNNSTSYPRLLIDTSERSRIELLWTRSQRAVMMTSGRQHSIYVITTSCRVNLEVMCDQNNCCQQVHKQTPSCRH